jgi:peptidyl-prolyl cis-trans isomerase C
MRKISFVPLMLLALAAITLVQVSPTQAQNTGVKLKQDAPTTVVVPDDQVVAVVGGSEILFRDVRLAHQYLPEQYRGLAIGKVYDPLLLQLVERRLVLLAAKADNLGNDPKVLAQVEQARDRILEQVYLTRKINAIATPKAMKEAYYAEKDGTGGPEEVRASHILVETQEEADAIVAALDKGGDFVALAKEKSKGPSGAKGGDLGYFTKDKMVPEFANAAFALKVGDVSAPVKTGFGWHVIKVVDRRKIKGPTFAERAPEIRQAMSQAIAEQVLADLSKATKVEMFKLDGTPGPTPPIGTQAK